MPFGVSQIMWILREITLLLLQELLPLTEPGRPKNWMGFHAIGRTYLHLMMQPFHTLIQFGKNSAWALLLNPLPKNIANSFIKAVQWWKSDLIMSFYEILITKLI